MTSRFPWPERPGRSGPRPTPAFHDRLWAACRANGWLLTRPLTADAACLKLSVHGVRQDVWALAEGEVVRAAGLSRARFPPGRFPPVLRAVLAMRAEQRPGVEWGVAGDRTGPRARVSVCGPLTGLDGPWLLEAVTRVTAELARFDRGLGPSQLVEREGGAWV